jgi:hypothetical protein
VCVAQCRPCSPVALCVGWGLLSSLPIPLQRLGAVVRRGECGVEATNGPKPATQKVHRCWALGGTLL